MKIDKVIVSSDDNRMYLDFWPTISMIWKTKFNIEPILFLVSDDKNLEKEISNSFGQVIRYDVIKDIPVYLQTLWIRYWGTNLFKNNICVISDIDMIPLSKWYFIEQIKHIDNDHYVHLNPCYLSYGTLPSCYHIGKGSLFSEILMLHQNWEISIKYLNGLNLGGGYGDKNKWFWDEIYASNMVFEYKKKNEKNVHFLNRIDGRRIDRSDWFYDENLLMVEFYYDSHSIRPFNENKGEISKIISFL